MPPRRSLLVVALTLALVLAACGGDSDDGADDAGDGTTTTTGAPATSDLGGDALEPPEPTTPPELGDGEVVLSVNGVETTEGELRAELAEAAEFAEANPGQADFLLLDADGNGTVEAARQLLQQRVEEVLATEALAAQGGAVTDADIAFVEDIIGELNSTPWLQRFADRSAQSVALQRVLREEAGVPETAEEWWAENGADAGFACSRHILLESEADADAARARVVDDGDEFADVAVELSTGPSGPAGGDLGCGDPASFVPEFAEAVRTLSIGEVSEPVETQFGFHVIEVTARGADVPFADVADAANQAWQQETAAAVGDSLVELTASADVVVDPAYGSWTGSQIAP